MKHKSRHQRFRHPSVNGTNNSPGLTEAEGISHSEQKLLATTSLSVDLYQVQWLLSMDLMVWFNSLCRIFNFFSSKYKSMYCKAVTRILTKCILKTDHNIYWGIFPRIPLAAVYSAVCYMWMHPWSQHKVLVFLSIMTHSDSFECNARS